MMRALAMLAVCFTLFGCAGMRARSANELPMREQPDRFIVVTLRNDSAPVATRAGSTLRGYDTAARYSAGPATRATVRALAMDHELREVSSWPIATLGVHCVVFELPPGTAGSDMLARLHHDRRVESAQPLQSFATQALTPAQAEPGKYNDPYESLQNNLASMEVPAAHRWSRGAGTHIAVIDTGVDIDHPDLAGRIAEQRNFVDADAETFRSDRHGTAVAGVIAASADNDIGIVGIAPEASLHAYKACWQPAAAGAAVCNTFTLAKALAAAIDARVQVVNLSLAGPADPLLTRLVVAGQQRGIVFVGAAPPDPAAMGFPTAVEGVIEVAALERQQSGRIQLLAPGAEVLTLAPQGHYDFASGSSVATANVSGAVALLLSRDRHATSARVRQLLASTAHRVPKTDASTRGVNACAALSALLAAPGCSNPALNSVMR
jgi:hypothetical protein